MQHLKNIGIIYPPNDNDAFIPSGKDSSGILFRYIIFEKSIQVLGIYDFNNQRWLKGNTISDKLKDECIISIKNNFIKCTEKKVNVK